MFVECRILGHALCLESTQQLRTWLLYGLTKTGKNPAPSPGSKEETLPSYPCRGKMTRRETCSGQGPALSTAGLWSLGSAGCGKWSLPTLTPDRCPASRVISQGGSESHKVDPRHLGRNRVGTPSHVCCRRCSKQPLSSLLMWSSG